VKNVLSLIILNLKSYPTNPTYEQRKSCQQQIATKKKKSKGETNIIFSPLVQRKTRHQKLVQARFHIPSKPDQYPVVSITWVYLQEAWIRGQNISRVQHFYKSNYNILQCEHTITCCFELSVNGVKNILSKTFSLFLARLVKFREGSPARYLSVPELYYK